MEALAENRPLVRVNKGCVSNLPDGCNIRVATWNVRTLNEDGKLSNLITEIRSLNIDVMGVAETHWDTTLPDAFEESGYVVLNSPRQDGIHRQGLSLIISSKLATIT